MGKKKRFTKNPRLWPGKNTVFPMHLFQQQGGWFHVFFAILSLILIYPYLESTRPEEPPWPLIVLNSAVLGLIIWAISFNRAQLFVGGGLAVLGFSLPGSIAPA